LFITGSSVSATTTLNEHVTVSQRLAAVTVTLVVPTGKNVPEFCEYVITGVGVPATVGAIKFTIAPHCPVVLFTGDADAQVVITGGVATTTFITLDAALFTPHITLKE
jgi:hypothetical protein